MRRVYLSIIAILSGFVYTSAQDVNHSKCAANHVLQKQLEDSEVRHSYDAFMQSAIDHANDPNVEVVRDEFGQRIIPVVFHILHKGKTGNISKEQILDQMRVFNEDFNRLNPDTTDTPHRFRKTEESRFQFASDNPNDYTSYTTAVSGVATDVPDITIAGVDMPCGTSLDYYSNGTVDYDRNDVIIMLDANVTNAGTGYIDGQYNGVPLIGGSGMGAFVDVTVVAGVVDSVALIFGGQGYVDAEALSVDPLNIGGTGSGFDILVDSINIQTVTYNIDAASVKAVLTIDSACGGTVSNEMLNIDESDFFYAMVGGLTVDSVMVDSVSSINTNTINALCHLEYASPTVNASGRESYITIATPEGDKYSFYFTNGVSGQAPSNAEGTLVEVQLPLANNNLLGSPTCGTSAQDIAEAFADAVDNLSDFRGLYVEDVFGNQTVRVIGEITGDAADFFSNELSSVVDSTYMDGGHLAAPLNAEFRLARKDPLGNCTEGIVRVFSSKSENARDDTGFKAESYWSATKYLNVWVINTIEALGGDGGTTLGYAQFPATGLSSTDGIAVRHDNIGAIGTGVARVGRTSVHEVGHWLGLRHVWGDAQCGSDDIADTPTAFEPNFGVCGNENGSGGFNFSAGFDQSWHVPNCNPDNWRGEMFNNYMDYSDDLCMNMFTQNQVDRMNFTLHGDGNDFGVRSELVSEENIDFTGTGDPYSADAGCAPVADFYLDQGSFYATTAMICAGGSVDFENHSYNSEINSVEWSFLGGTPNSSVDDNPEIDYMSAGIFDVSLTANGPNGANTKTNQNYVVVSPVTPDNQSNWGYVEAFWDSASFADDFLVFDHDADGDNDHGWQWYVGQNGGFSGSQSVKMRNIMNTRGQIDELVTPAFDLSQLTNATLQFRYSGAASNANPNDRLRIYSSKNCGETWTIRETMSDFELTNASFSSEGYSPNENSPWTIKSVPLSTHDDEPNVRVKFQWIAAGRSNNFYIDDITISGSTIGVNEQYGEANWILAPNPAHGTSRLTINTNGRADVQMKMYDLLGKEVRNLYNGELAKGAFNMDIDLTGLETGVYVIRATVNDQLLTERLIVD
jgi:PKD repeat protein